MKAHDFHASSQRIRELGEKQDVCRSGQKEPPRCAAAIHDCLDCGEEPGRTLNFVEDRSIGKVIHKSCGVGSCRGQHGAVVEAEIRVVPRFTDHARQCGFATLPWSVDQDNRRVLQRLGETWFNKSWIE